MSEATKGGVERIWFAKMEGAGNDFIVLSGSRLERLPDLEKLAQRTCARRTSVGADGLILVDAASAAGADVTARFWNPDGAEVATCGNGTRCAARFAVLEGLANGEEMTIDTLSGRIAARVDDRVVSLRYGAEPTIELDLTVTAADGAQRGHRVEIGNPHFIIETPDALPDGPIEPRCRPLRYAPELEPAGANVHLVQVVSRHALRIRSYERGVEAETLACGSGSMSSAIALCAAGQVESPVAVETRSGDTLTVRFQRQDDGRFTLLELEGPARLVYTGELDLPSPAA
ncbi:MAG: diaminopimelate epimerase [Gemmatimonadetes bacterium]|uniref:Diaminopimelate epimerase n=1 Tax=Candidatus Kutchimonas denitrificans TaxID=3056748 RepID=A0AAE4Z714_9BACT|nr:diaminopimelate epimerase [Gemmatimonadota bacterium]NIR74945.1 diaminopimelate epimerase [Candidatus Kutchimonas denitrificans]NIS00057.1 diaminopimelate epimerase [Gemmatimonadota bacterium]NIT65640.1 diaminopimelate epimerase [Gemmatimonadota bacterium]NIU52610.1 diaminopimelate epimerase [Gemmatimonadota bacterium]